MKIKISSKHYYNPITNFNPFNFIAYEAYEEICDWLVEHDIKPSNDSWTVDGYIEFENSEAAVEFSLIWS